MDKGECKRCFNQVLVVKFTPPDSKVALPIELDPEPAEFFAEFEGVVARGFGYRRHRFTCEERDSPDVGAAEKADAAGDAAGEIATGEE